MYKGARHNGLKDLLGPRPSLFDLCAVLGAMGMGFVPPLLQGHYLVYYSIFLACIGFSQKNERDISAPSLSIFCLIGLAGLYIHSFFMNPLSITFKYFNFMLMSEGFIYMLFGSLLFYTLATKGRNLRLFALTLPIAATGWIKSAIHGGQMSVILAFLVGIIAYLAYKRRYLFLGVMIATSLCLIFLCPLKFGGDNLPLWKWLCFKGQHRPAAWKELCYLISLHPFIGAGFNKVVGPDNYILVYNDARTVIMNCLHRQNDYLSLAQYVGIPILIGVAMFIKEGIARLKNSFLIVPFIAICVLCFVQMTLFWADRALVVVCSIATFYTET